MEYRMTTRTQSRIALAMAARARPATANLRLPPGDGAIPPSEG